MLYIFYFLINNNLYLGRHEIISLLIISGFLKGKPNASYLRNYNLFLINRTYYFSTLLEFKLNVTAPCTKKQLQ